MFGLAGCLGSGGQPDASESKALVREEAPKAIAIVAKAVSGTDLYAETHWESCMAHPVWRYEGMARFTAPKGDRNLQLSAIRDALLQAGYTDTVVQDSKVLTKQGRFVFIVAPALAQPPKPQQLWKASFRAEPCARYSRRERADIKANVHVGEPLPIP